MPPRAACAQLAQSREGTATGAAKRRTSGADGGARELVQDQLRRFVRHVESFSHVVDRGRVHGTDCAHAGRDRHAGRNGAPRRDPERAGRLRRLLSQDDGRAAADQHVPEVPRQRGPGDVEPSRPRRPGGSSGPVGSTRSRGRVGIHGPCGRPGRGRSAGAGWFPGRAWPGRASRAAGADRSVGRPRRSGPHGPSRHGRRPGRRRYAGAAGAAGRSGPRGSSGRSRSGGRARSRRARG
jgi:hypothetical protein